MSSCVLLSHLVCLLCIFSYSKISLIVISTPDKHFAKKCSGVTGKGDSEDAMGCSPRGPCRAGISIGRQVCTGDKTGGRFEIIKSVSAVFQEVGKRCFPLFCVTLLCEIFLLCCFKGLEGQYIHVKVWSLPLKLEYSCHTNLTELRWRTWKSRLHFVIDNILCVVNEWCT